VSKDLAVQDKLKKLKLLEKKKEVMDGLPHLYGMNWYTWAKNFFDSAVHYNFLCAANQISKSSTQMRKCVDWGTDVQKWPRLWRRRPTQFWYLYPTREVATIEFEKKWVEEWLPKAKFKDHPQYGWKPEYKNKFIWALHFNSGVSVYFKTYATDVSHLQSGSCDAIFADEELPFDLFPELNMRLAATQGYFHMVFTATLGQEEWRRTIEEIGQPGELFKGAFKQQVSMYDCLKYADGSPSHWTEERINELKNNCGTQNEVLRRIYGRFVVDQGLKYPSFDRFRNVKPVEKIDPTWLVYAGIDIGSGGEKGHPAAITFVAVRPDFKKARVVRGWRGDGVQTTSTDVFLKYLELKHSLNVTAAFYDWASADFAMVANRNGVPVMKAEKNHETGERIMNVLFKNDILSIDDNDDLRPLVQELATLQKDGPKNKAKDDFADSCRYAVTSIPWDFSVITGLTEIKLEQAHVPTPDEERRRPSQEPAVNYDVVEELESWNELY
jgi:hypothetical protein